MSRAATRQTRQGRVELGESWGDVDYEDVDESSENESPSASGSEVDEVDLGEDQVPRQAVNVNTSRGSRRPGSSRQQAKQQVALPTPKQRTRISTPSSTTKRTHQATRRTPDAMEPSFYMPSPSTQLEGTHGSVVNGTPTKRTRQSTTYQRSSGRGSLPVDSPPSALYESVESSWVNAQSPNMAHQRPSRKKPSRSQRPDSFSERHVLRPAKEDTSTSSYPAVIWDNIIRPTLTYVFSVMQHTMHILQPFLAYILLALLLHFAFWKGKNAVDTGIRMALSPVCNFPGASYLNIPFCLSPPTHGHERFDALVEAQSSFEEVAKYSMKATGLRQDMKNKEMAMRDLRSVIDFSNLGSKQELGHILNSYIATSRQSSDDIGNWNAKVDYALDRILSLNQHTLGVLEATDLKDDGMSLAKRFFVGVGLAARPKTREDEVFDTYVRQASGMEEEVKRLIHKVDYILGQLDVLENLLDGMENISMQEELTTKGHRSELLGQLYTKLGGNRREKGRIEANLLLLNEIQAARHFAYTILTNALAKLKDIARVLENLREEMGRPQEDGFREVPIQVHLGTIKKSVDRLTCVRESKMKVEQQVRDGVWLDAEESPSMRTIETSGKAAKKQLELSG